MKKLVLLAGLMLFAFQCLSQSIIPDAGFGNNGVAVVPEAGKSSVIHSIAIQNDGRIVAAGENYDDSLNLHTSIMRLLADGTIDNSFGTGGKVNLAVGWHDGLQSVAIQPDGKIVVAGNQTEIIDDPSNPNPGVIIVTEPFIIRYQSNGTLDSAFGTNGIHHLDILDNYATRSASSIALLPNGKIIVGGTLSILSLPQMFLVGLNSDGTYDNGFGINGLGRYTIEAGKGAVLFDVHVQVDGKLLLAGYSGTASVVSLPDTRMAVARVNMNGSLDASFANAGVGALPVSINNPNPFDVAKSVKTDANGKIVLAGGASNALAIVRLNTNGLPDQSFGQGGIVYDNSRVTADGLCVLNNGRLLITGLKANTNPYTTDITLSRFTANGGVDASFGIAGDMLIDESEKDRAYAFTVQPDNKILLAGHSVDQVSGNASFTLWRYSDINTGISQTSLQDIITLYPNPATENIIVNFSEAPSLPVVLKLYDITGKNVITTIVQSQSVTLNLQQQAKGVYLLQVFSGDKMQTFKVCKN